jgi:hypothetical protein
LKSSSVEEAFEIFTPEKMPDVAYSTSNMDNLIYDNDSKFKDSPSVTFTEEPSQNWLNHL